MPTIFLSPLFSVLKDFQVLKTESWEPVEVVLPADWYVVLFQVVGSGEKLDFAGAPTHLLWVSQNIWSIHCKAILRFKKFKKNLRFKKKCHYEQEHMFINMQLLECEI